MAKLVDALDLGSSAVRRGGSIPFIRTKIESPTSRSGFLHLKGFIKKLVNYEPISMVSTFSLVFNFDRTKMNKIIEFNLRVPSILPPLWAFLNFD